MKNLLQELSLGQMAVDSSDVMDDGSLLSRTKRYVVSQGFMEQSRVVALYIIFIILILIVNGFTIVVFLWSRAMRSSSRHVLILSVCLGDLLMGIFVLPVLLNLGLQSEGENTNCSTFHAMRIFADFLVPSVTTLAVLVLNIDYILRISWSAYGEGLSRVSIMTCLFLFPWIFSCCLLIPLYVDGLHSGEDMQGIIEDTCADSLDLKSWGEKTRTLIIISYFPQAFLVLIFNIIVTSMYLLKRDSFGLDVCGERIRAPVDICLASFATLVLYTPVFLIQLLTTYGYLGCVGDDECSKLRDVQVAALWGFCAKSWLLPFVWLVCRDTRASIRKLPG